MKIERTGENEVTVTLTGTELRIINNCIGEALDAFEDDAEFHPRIGATIAEATALLDAVHPLASSVKD
jgi:hypothetical protein